MSQGTIQANQAKSSNDISILSQFSLTRETLLDTEYLENALFSTQGSDGRVNIFLKILKHYRNYGDMCLSLEEIRRKTTFKSRTSVKRNMEKMQKEGFLIIHKNFTAESLRCSKGYMANTFTLTKLIYYVYEMKRLNKRAIQIPKIIKRVKNKEKIKALEKEQNIIIARILHLGHERAELRRRLDSFHKTRKVEPLVQKKHEPFIEKRQKKLIHSTENNLLTKTEIKEKKKEIILEKVVDSAVDEKRKREGKALLETLLTRQICRKIRELPMVREPSKEPIANNGVMSLGDTLMSSRRKLCRDAIQKLEIRPWNIPMEALPESAAAKIELLAQNMTNLSYRPDEQKKLYDEVLDYDDRHGLKEYDVNAQLSSDERFHEYIKRSPNYTESVWKQ